MELYAQYKIVPILPNDLQGVIDYLINFHYGYDPITEYLIKTGVDKFQLVGPSLTTKNEATFRKGLSLKAVTKSHEIIGLSINEELPETITATTPELAILINELNKTMNDKLIRCSTLLTRILTVHPKRRGEGIGKALLLETARVAKQNNFNQIRAHCISAYSAKLFENIGFNYVQSVAYKDFKINGNPVFELNPPHTHVHGMVLEL
ncbi:hypothetical protein FQA39_LY00600 [Lamprigera yunnana]|nr:hypothetical protein FQA39_LY00600 [Lamprigera yunnana]